MRTHLALLVVATLVYGSANVAGAAPAKADANAHFEAAAELYAREDYAGAAREFAIAHALDPQVDTLFAWAQAERLAEHYDEAVDLYERLLDGELSASQREAVGELLAEVRALADANPAPVDEPVESDEVIDEPDDTPPDDTPPDRDRVAPALVGVGASLALIGGGLVVGGLVADTKVRNATSYPDFEQAFDPNTQRGRGAVALYASGGVFAGIGVITLIVGAVRMSRNRGGDPGRSVALSPWFGPNSTGLGLRVEGLR